MCPAMLNRLGKITINTQLNLRHVALFYSSILVEAGCRSITSPRLRSFHDVLLRSALFAKHKERARNNFPILHLGFIS